MHKVITLFYLLTLLTSCHCQSLTHDERFLSRFKRLFFIYFYVFNVFIIFSPTFLPRNAMLARYMLSSCARLSVGPLQASIVSKSLDELSWFLARRLSSTCPTLRYTEICVPPKIRILPGGTLS